MMGKQREHRLSFLLLQVVAVLLNCKSKDLTLQYLSTNCFPSLLCLSATYLTHTVSKVES